MDYDIIRQTLEVTLDEVAFKKDENGNDISIFAKAQNNLKTFLDENTSISDDKKAEYYSNFLTNIIVGVTTQAIQVAGDSPLKEAQIYSMKKEIDQKVISMQNDDKAKLNETASRVADIKAKIETLYPAQVRDINKSADLKDAQIQTEQKRTSLFDKDIELKQGELQLTANEALLKSYMAENERSKLGLTAQQIGLTQSEIEYKLAQIKAIQEASRVNKEIEHEKNETQLKIAELYAVSGG